MSNVNTELIRALCPNQQQTNKSATGARKSIDRRSFECLRFVCARETRTHHNVLAHGDRVCHSIQLCFIFNIVFAFVVSPLCADVVCNFHYDLCCSLFDSTITWIEIDQIKSCICPFHSIPPFRCVRSTQALANVPMWLAAAEAQSIKVQCNCHFHSRIASLHAAQSATKPSVHYYYWSHVSLPSVAINMPADSMLVVVGTWKKNFHTVKTGRWSII